MVREVRALADGCRTVDTKVAAVVVEDVMRWWIVRYADGIGTERKTP